MNGGCKALNILMTESHSDFLVAQTMIAFRQLLLKATALLKMVIWNQVSRSFVNRGVDQLLVAYCMLTSKMSGRTNSAGECSYRNKPFTVIRSNI